MSKAITNLTQNLNEITMINFLQIIYIQKIAIFFRIKLHFKKKNVTGVRNVLFLESVSSTLPRELKPIFLRVHVNESPIAFQFLPVFSRNS